MPAHHPATLDADALLQDCDVTRGRRSGPGGQHRNKVETAIRLKHQPTGVTAEASERRSQANNQTVAVRRLRMNLALEVRTAIEAQPSSLLLDRINNGSLKVSIDHEEFPAVIAAILDELAAADWNVSAVTERIGCRTSPLVKLLKKEPRALALLNQHRQEIGLGPLR